MTEQPTPGYPSPQPEPGPQPAGVPASPPGLMPLDVSGFASEYSGEPIISSALDHIERHHWLNTVVGLIDSVWHLTLEEQFHTIRIVRSLLERLNIPERGQPREVPAPLALEVDGGFYTTNLSAEFDSAAPRPIRAIDRRDLKLPLEVWATSLVNLFTSAYPDIEPIERIYLTRAFMDLLTSLGAAQRAPSHIPDDVARTARSM